MVKIRVKASNQTLVKLNVELIILLIFKEAFLKIILVKLFVMNVDNLDYRKKNSFSIVHYADMIYVQNAFKREVVGLLLGFRKLTKIVCKKSLNFVKVFKMNIFKTKTSLKNLKNSQKFQKDSLIFFKSYVNFQKI